MQDLWYHTRVPHARVFCVCTLHSCACVTVQKGQDYELDTYSAMSESNSELLKSGPEQEREQTLLKSQPKENSRRTAVIVCSGHFSLFLTLSFTSAFFML